MASSALDILSVASFKTAVRLEGDAAEHDALIADYIASAAEWIENQCALGIVDTEVSAVVRVGALDKPLTIAHRSHAVEVLRYRRAGDAGVAFASYAGAAVAGEPQGSTTFPAPTSGWPALALQIAYTTTTPAQHVPNAIRTAIILYARDLYDGKAELGATGGVGSGRPWAVNTIIQPYRALG